MGVGYHPTPERMLKMIYQQFKATETDFISTIEEWISEHSKNFTRVETPGEILWTNSKGEFVLYKVKNNIRDMPVEREVGIGNPDTTTNGWLCTWDTICEKFYYVENFECMPHTELTPHVAELIETLCKRFETVYEYSVDAHERWD